MPWLCHLSGPFGGHSSLGVAMVLLALLFSSSGFFSAWLSFKEVVLDLLVSSRVSCEGDYSSFDVVSLLVYQDATSGFFGSYDCGSSPGGVPVFLSGVLLGVYCLGVYGNTCEGKVLWPLPSRAAGVVCLLCLSFSIGKFHCTPGSVFGCWGLLVAWFQPFFSPSHFPCSLV